LPAVVVRNAPRSPSIDGRAVKRRAESMLRELGREEAELSVLLTDDASIEVLNREHRRKAKPTDVLAFPMDGEGPSGPVPLLGDVVISLDTALRQARRHRHALMTEVTHLLAHGVLHLVGYDHRTDAEERRMNLAVARLVDAATPRRARRASLSRRVRDRS
jgi:probable rRNA maturation factor